MKNENVILFMDWVCAFSMFFVLLLSWNMFPGKNDLFLLLIYYIFHVTVLEWFVLKLTWLSIHLPILLLFILCLGSGTWAHSVIHVNVSLLEGAYI